MRRRRARRRRWRGRERRGWRGRGRCSASASGERESDDRKQNAGGQAHTWTLKHDAPRGPRSMTPGPVCSRWRFYPTAERLSVRNCVSDRDYRAVIQAHCRSVGRGGSPSDPRGRRSLTVRHPGVQLTGGGIFDEIVSSEPSASSGCQAFGLLGAAPEGRAPLDSAAVSGHPKRQHQGGAARLSHRHRQVSGCAERHSRRRRSRLDVLVEMEDVVWVVPAFQRDQPVVLGSPVDLRTGGVRFDDLVDVSAR